MPIGSSATTILLTGPGCFEGPLKRDWTSSIIGPAGTAVRERPTGRWKEGVGERGVKDCSALDGGQGWSQGERDVGLEAVRRKYSGEGLLGDSS